MSSVTGLTRRRVAPSNSISDNIPGTSSSTPSSSTSTPAPAPPTASGLHGHAGTALEGGNHIAYDPRDLGADVDEDGGKVPRLTILEEVLLLGLKDKQGYLSFWNDNISYALRGCILIELALRRRIAMVRDPARRRLPLPDRLIEVIDVRQTGETILDEALKMINTTEEKMGVGSWIDLMSGETWNVLKIGFQLKQVRERLAKGLVDKGILRTEKRNFLLFDMATHPIADPRTKETLLTRVSTLLTARTTTIPPQALDREGVQARVGRGVALVLAAYAGSVLEGALGRLGYEEREEAFGRCDDILAEFCCWPFGSAVGIGEGGGPVGGAQRKREGGARGKDAVGELVRAVKREMREEDDVCYEVVATVFEVFSRMDSLL
ncbi:GPP34-domain-containing protein [Ramaria rubella]|nr:GPP34-domain-containing protein [Ramaria rubella]